MLVARQFNFHYKNTLWIYSIWQLQSLKIWKETEDYIYTEHASIRTTENIHQIDSKFTCSVKILNFICYVKNQSIVEQIDNSIRCWSRSLFQIKLMNILPEAERVNISREWWCSSSVVMITVDSWRRHHTPTIWLYQFIIFMTAHDSFYSSVIYHKVPVFVYRQFLICQECLDH